LDPTGNLYIAGSTGQLDFPVTPGAYQTSFHGGCPYPAFQGSNGFFGVFTYVFNDGFVFKLSADGSKPVYSTLLGGSCYDRAAALAVDATGQAYVAGETDSGDFPLNGAIQAAPIQPQFLSFLSVLSSDGSS